MSKWNQTRIMSTDTRNTLKNEELNYIGGDTEAGELMSWVAVHKSVNGPKLRKLYKKLKCSKFEALGMLVFFWMWGQDNANKDGRIMDADREDIERYLYGESAGCELKMKDVVDALFSTGWLDQTDHGMYIHDWEIWQEQWYKAMDKREKDAKRKADIRKHKRENGNSTEPEITFDAVGDKTSSSSKYSVAFEEFWKVYPRHADKGMAYKKYQARRHDGYSDEELITAAKNYASECARMRTQEGYIKHPKTFLGDSMPFQEYLPGNSIRSSPHNDDILEPGENPFAEWGDDS